MGWWAYGKWRCIRRTGDSGAIVVDDMQNAVGMLVAVEHDGIEAGAFVHGIKQILEALDIALYED